MRWQVNFHSIAQSFAIRQMRNKNMQRLLKFLLLHFASKQLVVSEVVWFHKLPVKREEGSGTG